LLQRLQKMGEKYELQYYAETPTLGNVSYLVLFMYLCR
jgi:hypothetical protein